MRSALSFSNMAGSFAKKHASRCDFPLGGQQRKACLRGPTLQPLLTFHDLDRQLEINACRRDSESMSFALRYWVLSPGWDPTLNSRIGPRPESFAGPKSILSSR